MKVSAMNTPERRERDLDAELRQGGRSSRWGEYSAVSAMPATAVGSANGRSTRASMMRLPGKS
jgi:hypothetical protein